MAGPESQGEGDAGLFSLPFLLFTYTEVHMLTADQVAEKWARNTTAAAPTYRDAVQSLTVNPLQRAAEKADDWQARVSDSRTKEKFRNGLQRYSFEEWKAKTATVGASRIADGVRQAAPRMRAFLQELLPYTQSLKERIRAMPKRNEAEADARLQTAVAAMRQFRRRS
jgi:hypothetical protein